MAQLGLSLNINTPYSTLNPGDVYSPARSLGKLHSEAFSEYFNCRLGQCWEDGRVVWSGLKMIFIPLFTALRPFWNALKDF